MKPINLINHFHADVGPKRIQEHPGDIPLAPNGRKFDRLIAFDERSRNFPVRAVLPRGAERNPRSFTWSCSIRLDQGQEGACVGFGWAHELASRPSVIEGVTYSLARDRIYKEAQKIDEWPGEGYEGTSVLAGAKMIVKLGAAKSYRWGFSLMDARLAIGYVGPVVFGLNWKEGMIQPDSQGFIHAVGQDIGGHCILGFANSERGKYVTLLNSWGPDWGLNGTAKISYDDLDRLLGEYGECCIPVERVRVNL